MMKMKCAAQRYNRMRPNARKNQRKIAMRAFFFPIAMLLHGCDAHLRKIVVPVWQTSGLKSRTSMGRDEKEKQEQRKLVQRVRFLAPTKRGGRSRALLRCPLCFHEMRLYICFFTQFQL